MAAAVPSPAVTGGSPARRDDVAHGLATALLARPWTLAAMHGRCKDALGRTRAPRWLDALVHQVLAVYHQPPHDGPRELAAYLQACVAWETAWRQRRPPRIVKWTPVPTEMGRPAWPVTELPDVEALCRLLDLDQGELAWFADVRDLERQVANPLRHYRWSVLPKRSGVRLVAAPKPRLKEIQRRLLRHVFAPIPAHDAAHGCVPGRSVRTAIEPHAGTAVVIRADLTAFFAAIPAGRIWELLRVAGYPEAVAHAVTGLVTTVVPLSLTRAVRDQVDDRVLRGFAVPHLPQGAPTSPAVANAVAFTLDRRLAGLAARFDARYTRYVDDLMFSGGVGLRRGRFVERVDEIVRREGFRLNERKTVAMSAARRQAALGAVLNARPTLPREERDRLRAVLHNCVVHGWRSQQRDVPDLRAHLLGRIAWANGVDPVFGAKARDVFDRIDWS